MTYRNTPDRDTGRSPSQVIFGRELRDFLPAPLKRYKPQPQWILLREDRERALSKRAIRNMEQLKFGTKELVKLDVHDVVKVQNQVGNYPSRWDITGTIVEVKPYDQYVIKVHGSGRLTTRNRKFLKKIHPYAHDLPALNFPPTDVSRHIVEQPDTQINDGDVLPRDVVVEEEEFVQEPGVSDQYSPEVPELRRSSRSRREPQRLEVDWKSKTYDGATAVQSVSCATACHDSDYHDTLIRSKPCGGRGHLW